MTEGNRRALALDVGERRIGVALADMDSGVAAPLATITVDGLEEGRLREMISEYEPALLVVGLPRNQDGEETRQSTYVRQFIRDKLEKYTIPVALQDESLTSVLAEDHLKKTKKNYTKADIDMHAAAIILTDYLEMTHGHPARA